MTERVILSSEEKTAKKHGRTKRIILGSTAAVLALAILMFVLSAVIYHMQFNRRFESYEPLMLYPEDFEGLRCERYRFPSDKGQMLTGYLYSTEESERGVVVIAHGFGGGGQNAYMDCADYFARHGYYVFAYDATGNDESEGGGTNGLPQGVIDLDYAISFVEDSGYFPDLPIVLFGHSWGGYSACSVLSCHPEVKAVVSCAGFNRSADMLESKGRKYAGDISLISLPFALFYESLCFGQYASSTAMGGFDRSDAAVMILHSADDETVPIEYGYGLYYETYRDDPRFTFVRFEDRGHSYVYDDMTYIDEFNSAFDRWRGTLGYDPEAPENAQRFADDKAAYIREHLDRKAWSTKIDEDLFDRFVAFYDAHIQ